MMSPAVTNDPAALAASLTQWWALAGVDIAVQDIPRDWLSRRLPAAIPVPAIAPESPVHGNDILPVSPPVPQVESGEHIATPMPDALEPFMEWLTSAPHQPESGFSQIRVLPRVVHQPELLVITDMPTQDDMIAGQLFAGTDAHLLSGLLRALGVEMQRTALASLMMASPAGGIIDDKILQRVAGRLAHLTRLIAPKAVILLGDKTNRAFQQMNGSGDTLSTCAINLNDDTISAIALPAPFVLLKHPERKAAAWAQLRHLAKK